MRLYAWLLPSAGADIRIVPRHDTPELMIIFPPLFGRNSLQTGIWQAILSVCFKRRGQFTALSHDQVRAASARLALSRKQLAKMTGIPLRTLARVGQVEGMPRNALFRRSGRFWKLSEWSLFRRTVVESADARGNPDLEAPHQLWPAPPLRLRDWTEKGSRKIGRARDLSVPLVALRIASSHDLITQTAIGVPFDAA